MKALLIAAIATASCAAAAQDAHRGAELYMQLPGTASCVSCHGPDPAGNRNNLLKAANNPLALLKALNAVGAMGYLKPLLDDVAIAELAAFLGSVAQIANPQARLDTWPLTADLGSPGFGRAGGPQRIRIRNRSSMPINLASPAVRGALWSISHDCPITLMTGASCTVSVSLAAGALGPAAGSVSIASDATTAPVIAALAGFVRPDGAGVLTWLPDPLSVDLGTTAIGQAATRDLTLVNGGSAAITLGSTTVIGPNAGQFVVSGCARAMTLPPSSACVMTLRHASDSAGPAEAVLQVRSDGANPPALVVRAQAVATASITDDAQTGAGALNSDDRRAYAGAARDVITRFIQADFTAAPKLNRWRAQLLSRCLALAVPFGRAIRV